MKRAFSNQRSAISDQQSAYGLDESYQNSYLRKPCGHDTGTVYAHSFTA
ncbi:MULTISPECIES: hypothetical protein [unclassified Moorena]|nr:MULTISPECIES: hypothetical protein [unclassified Moorena]NEQ15490.1 hypothetical protein [Moorena sp. SIO3E2]NER91043.1 hypothetical protein [Moorena sp. SIO3A2]NES40589.1 hypothetical protein [Moorena sp. SIO2C4]